MYYIQSITNAYDIYWYDDTESSILSLLCTVLTSNNTMHVLSYTDMKETTQNKFAF